MEEVHLPSKPKLKVLWISPVMTGEGKSLFGLTESPTRGWTQHLWDKLIKSDQLEMAIAVHLSDDETGIKIGSDGARYISLPKSRNKARTEELYKEIKELFDPDVIHIHGTEYCHGKEWVDNFGNENVVASIQGLVSAYTRYYLGGISLKEFPLTVRDIIMRQPMKAQYEEFASRGANERKFIAELKHVIGRTEWDRDHAKAINPDISYYYGGETLRTPFYQHKWKYENSKPHTIFMSQGYYPIKGLHKAIEALPIVMREFPDVKIRLSGYTPFGTTTLRRGGYGAYLLKLMKKLGVEDRIEYIGSLDAESMCKEFLKANLFLLPSAIENSPNSLGEARMLEMPFLASYCGGTPDLCSDVPEALYRFEETEMLAAKIIDIFRQGAEFKPAPAPFHFYDPEKNVRELIETYHKVAHSDQ